MSLKLKIEPDSDGSIMVSTVKKSKIHVWGHGKTLSLALLDFRSKLLEYYGDLINSEENMEKNLHKELKYLRGLKYLDESLEIYFGRKDAIS